jgi:hypothetical protein
MRGDYCTAPSQFGGVGAGVPPFARPVGSREVGVARTPGKDTQPAPSVRWNQTPLFHGAVLIGYAGRLGTHPLTEIDILPGKLPTCVDKTFGWIRMAVPAGAHRF